MSNTTRYKIVATTSRLLERQGYHATGLNQIVKESGTPRGSLYYYFPDGKEELAVEAVTQRMSQMADHTRRVLSEIDDAAEAIHALFIEIANGMEKQACGTGAPIAAVALEASNSSEPLRQACATGYQGLEDIFAAKLVMSGYSSEKAGSLAATINASIEGAMIMSRTKQDIGILINMANDLKTLIEITPKE